MENDFFIWSSDLSIGIDEIDNQHKEIITLINKLYSAFMKKEDGKIIKDVINKMLDYAKYHFGAEEAYFLKFNYRDAMLHQKKHEAFIDKIAEFQEEYDNNETALTYRIMNFLQKWLKEHIIGEDIKYVNYFKLNGLG